MTEINTADSDIPVSELEFRFKGNSLSLNFVATVGERWRRNIERLRAPRDLDRWAEQAGLGRLRRGTTAGDLEQARELREAIYRSARAATVDGPLARKDLQLINDWAARPSVPLRLISVGKSRLGPPEGSETVLAAVARDAIGLLSEEAARIRECNAANCSTLFVDRSRGGERQWCSKGCADRVNAYRYRHRHRPVADSTP